ncbi:MAG: hypothetical protein AB7G75_27955 [Candidatus Binatia bacterium]
MKPQRAEAYMPLTPKQRREALKKGLSISLTTDDTKYLNPSRSAAFGLFAKEAAKGMPPTLPADGQPEALPADRESQEENRQTVDRKHYRQTVSQKTTKHYRQTGSEKDGPSAQALPADGQTAPETTSLQQSLEAIPLAPVQWAIWEALRRADADDAVISYRKLAHAAGATIRGVRDALAVIEKEGGVRSKVTVRTVDEQGMRIIIDPAKPFKPASLKETKGIIKRGTNYRQTVNRKSAMLPADGLRLSVCITEFIKQTDIAELLRTFPASWNIRERTLVEIARQFPTMTLMEYRRSLSHLVQQATRSIQTIANHNAWLKAAFVRNEGPFVTERMIEAQLDALTQTSRSRMTQPDDGKAEDPVVTAEFEALRRYIGANSETKSAIESAAEKKTATALRLVPPDRHEQIRQQALIEAAQEYFEKSFSDK